MRLARSTTFLRGFRGLSIATRGLGSAARLEQGFGDSCGQPTVMLPVGGRVLVHEMLLDADRVGPTHALGYSMTMVFVAQGRQRSADEIRELLGSTGFRDLEVTPTANGYALIAGTK